METLYKRWLASNEFRTNDLARANLLDVMEKLARDLESEDSASVEGWMAAMYLGGDPMASLTQERLDEYHLVVLDREAEKALHQWAPDQISPTVAKGLAAINNTPGLYDAKITLLLSRGSEYIINVPTAWTEQHPGILEAVGTEDGIMWRSAAIPIKEYVAMHGRSPVSVRQLAERGSLKTAHKVGRNWLVNLDEPYPDHRRRQTI